MQMTNWVRLPTEWIEAGGLRQFSWADKEHRSGFIAALMVLMALAHRAAPDMLECRMTYDDLSKVTHLSRAKVWDGLRVLAEMGVIVRQPNGQSTYRLVYEKNARWAKLPARALYSSGTISFLKSFNLRLRSELDALKIYLLLVNRKSFDRNVVELTYSSISRYSGISESYIADALAFLTQLGLIRVDYTPLDDRFGKASIYRITHLEPRTTRLSTTAPTEGETDFPF